MEIASAFTVMPSDGQKPGAYAVFPYDRELVERFRDRFPRARWRGELGWFVPGTTAVRRLDSWMAQQLETLDRHADAKGRDAFLFDPLESPYLSVADDLVVRTPYSRTVVDALRAVPWASWDPDGKVWRVPFRSYESLRQKWPLIEEAARRNEPAEKRRRREEEGTRLSERTSLIQAERRRRRYPVPGDDLPPLGCPVATLAWGVVVFEEIEEEPISDLLSKDVYPQVRDDTARFVWARWRMPTLQEIYRAKPAREEDAPSMQAERGWWQPSRDDLRERARKLRWIERGQQARMLVRKNLIET